MPSSSFYHNYPKAAARLTKALLILLTASAIIGYIFDRLFAKRPDRNADTQTHADGKQLHPSLVQDKSLLITILIVAGVLLCLYFIIERSGILAKIRRWYSSTQSSLTSFTERPKPRDFNELGD